LVAKTLAPLIACFVFSVPLWPLMALCIRSVSFGSETSRTGISLTQALGTIGVLAATIWCFSAWGLFFSGICRRTPIALAWTGSTLFGALVIAPFFLSIQSAGEEIMIFHPIAALQFVSVGGWPNQGQTSLGYVAVPIIGLFLLGCAVLLALSYLMRNRARKSDGRHLKTRSSTRIG
jgi:hypothetical protein